MIILAGLFFAELMHAMGFGSLIDLMYTLSTNSKSFVVMNGGVTELFLLTRLVRQGFPSSPLLFAIATYPVLTMLSNLAENNGGNSGQ